MRIKITLAYDGTDFFGSQVQKQQTNTVMGQLGTVFEALGITNPVIASGRTDRGVHATAQVCHVDLPPFWKETQKLKRVANEMLPFSIRIRKIEAVPDDFHARYSAKRRVYRYIIKTGEPDAFESRFVTFMQECDIAELNEKMRLFRGEHDFAFFQKTGSDIQNTLRTLYRAFAYKHKNYIILHYEANGFLRAQVRLMSAALFALSQEQILQMLRKEKRHKLKPVIPNGLYLAKIKY